VGCDGFHVPERCPAASRNRASRASGWKLLYIDYIESPVSNTAIPPLPIALAAALRALMTWLSGDLALNRFSSRVSTTSIAPPPPFCRQPLDLVDDYFAPGVELELCAVAPTRAPAFIQRLHGQLSSKAHSPLPP
jgi:hypothetical protein